MIWNSLKLINFTNVHLAEKPKTDLSSTSGTICSHRQAVTTAQEKPAGTLEEAEKPSKVSHYSTKGTRLTRGPFNLKPRCSHIFMKDSNFGETL